MTGSLMMDHSLVIHSAAVVRINNFQTSVQGPRLLCEALLSVHGKIGDPGTIQTIQKTCFSRISSPLYLFGLMTIMNVHSSLLSKLHSNLFGINQKRGLFFHTKRSLEVETPGGVAALTVLGGWESLWSSSPFFHGPNKAAAGLGKVSTFMAGRVGMK